MNKKWINIMLLTAVLIAIAVVITDYLSTRPGKRPPNPFAFDISEYEAVDINLVSHHESRQIRLSGSDPVHIASDDSYIYLLTMNMLQVLTPGGMEISSFSLIREPLGIAIGPDELIYIAYDNQVVATNMAGEVQHISEAFSDRSILTALAAAGDRVFAADAGNRQVIIMNSRLELIDTFKGESGVSALHGFILPSLHFDLAVNAENELWIVNPGLHSLQHYSLEGRFRRQWGKPSFEQSGFSGCCNPSYVAFFADSRIVTSEKGLVRIKIYRESGELESVVAPPASFKNGLIAPAITTMSHDVVVALDFDRNMIRIFEPNERP